MRLLIFSLTFFVLEIQCMESMLMDPALANDRYPLHWVLFGPENRIDDIIEQASHLDEMWPNGKTVLITAAEAGAVTVVKKLINAGATYPMRGHSLLHIGAKHGHPHLVRYCLETLGLDPTMRNGEGFTPLGLAFQIPTAYAVVRKKVIELLVPVSPLFSAQEMGRIQQGFAQANLHLRDMSLQLRRLKSVLESASHETKGTYADLDLFIRLCDGVSFYLMRNMFTLYNALMQLEGKDHQILPVAFVRLCQPVDHDDHISHLLINLRAGIH